MKGTLETINHMSLRIEEYMEKTFEQLQTINLEATDIREAYEEAENKKNLAIINLQKAHLINECMREMVKNINDYTPTNEELHSQQLQNLNISLKGE